MCRGNRKCNSRTFPEHGLDNKDVWYMHSPVKRIVKNKYITIFHLIPKLIKQCLHCIRYSAHMKRNGYALCNHFAATISERRGKIKRIPNDCRARGSIKCHRHLVSRRRKSGTQNLTGDRVDFKHQQNSNMTLP